MNETKPGPTANRKPDWLFRPQDKRWYLAFVCYTLVIFGLLSLFYGSIDGYLLLATVVPLFAVTVLVGAQIVARPRCSAVAFVLILGGVLALGWRAFRIAAWASASV